MVSLPLARAFYFLSLGALGGMVPLLAARLDAADLGGSALGAMMAMLPLGRLLSAPMWAWAADRWRMAGLLLRIGCLVALVGAALILFAEGPLTAAAGIFLFAVGRAPLGPLVDAAVLESLSAAGTDRAEYGRIRLWGSAGFLFCALLAGDLADRVGLDPVWVGLALLAATFVCAFWFPTRGEGGPAPVLPALRELAREPFLVPFLVTGFLQALTLSVYDTFFSTHVHALGLPDIVTGAAVAVGVTCEVVVMRFARPLLVRFGAARILLAATVLGVPRWALTAVVTDPAMLVAIQALHGVVFGAFWIAGIQLMAERAPARVMASAQSLFSAVSYGFGALLGAFLAGEVREWGGTDGVFEALAAISVLAVGSAMALQRRERARTQPATP